MMKKRFIDITQFCVILLVPLLLAFCNDDISGKQEAPSRGFSLIPNKAEVGQKISISGPNFKDATEIIFPTDISVTTFERVGGHQLDVVVPEGIEDGGNIIVRLPKGDFTLPIALNLINPIVLNAYPESGAKDIGPHERLVIVGKDLINVSEIVFPGDAKATVRSMDFTRKSDEEIIVTVPSGTDKVVAPVTLLTEYGKVFSSTNVDFTGGGYIPPEYVFLCGEDGNGKTWTWDKDAKDGIVYGNGGYRTDVIPAWWKVHYENLASGVDIQDGLGATMEFRFSYDGNIMIKTLVNGTQYKGTYKIDMSRKVTKYDGSPWSIGRFEIETGDPELTIIGGIGSRWGVLKGFDILKLTDSEFVLANEYPDEPGTSAYYMYRAIE